MPKQRWMTIQMLIWFIQICNLKNRLLNRDPIHKWLTNIGISAWLTCSSTASSSSKYRVAHLHHHFFFLGELYHLALHGCSSDLSKEPLVSSFNRGPLHFSFTSLHVFCWAALHSLARGGVLLEHPQDSSVVLLVVQQELWSSEHVCLQGRPEHNCR